MSEKNENALEELAEFLKGESAPSSEEFKAKAIEHFGVESWKRHEERKRKFDKCSRIIAELAKVKVEAIKENPSMVGGAFINLMAECRAIAEGKGVQERRV